VTFIFEYKVKKYSYLRLTLAITLATLSWVGAGSVSQQSPRADFFDLDSDGWLVGRIRTTQGDPGDVVVTYPVRVNPVDRYNVKIQQVGTFLFIQKTSRRIPQVPDKDPDQVDILAVPIQVPNPVTTLTPTSLPPTDAKDPAAILESFVKLVGDYSIADYEAIKKRPSSSLNRMLAEIADSKTVTASLVGEYRADLAKFINESLEGLGVSLVTRAGIAESELPVQFQALAQKYKDPARGLDPLQRRELMLLNRFVLQKKLGDGSRFGVPASQQTLPRGVQIFPSSIFPIAPIWTLRGLASSSSGYNVRRISEVDRTLLAERDLTSLSDGDSDFIKGAKPTEIEPLAVAEGRESLWLINSSGHSLGELPNYLKGAPVPKRSAGEKEKFNVKFSETLFVPESGERKQGSGTNTYTLETTEVSRNTVRMEFKAGEPDKINFTSAKILLKQQNEQSSIIAQGNQEVVRYLPLLLLPLPKKPWEEGLEWTPDFGTNEVPYMRGGAKVKSISGGKVVISVRGSFRFTRVVNGGKDPGEPVEGTGVWDVTIDASTNRVLAVKGNSQGEGRVRMSNRVIASRRLYSVEIVRE
jgi:hypothetical protein